MVELNDREGKKIQEGFYFNADTGHFIYFTGAYKGLTAICEDSNRIEQNCSQFSTIHWVRINNVKECVLDIRKDLEWMENRNYERKGKIPKKTVNRVID